MDLSFHKADAMPQNLGFGGFALLGWTAMNFLGREWIADWLGGLGRITLLTRDAIASCLTFKVAWRDLLYQIYFIGIKSQSVVLVTGAFTGMVLAAQTYFQFHKIKMDTATLANWLSRFSKKRNLTPFVQKRWSRWFRTPEPSYALGNSLMTTLVARKLV